MPAEGFGGRAHAARPLVDRSSLRASRPGTLTRNDGRLAEDVVHERRELVAVPEERDRIDETVRAHAIRQAVARLSPEHRAVLLQVYYRGLSIMDAAAVLRIPPGTVKSRTYYALRSLRAILDELGIS